MARPSWLKYLGRGDHPVLDRLFDAFANGGLNEAHVGTRLLRFITVAGPPPADTAVRAGDSRPVPTVFPAESAVIVPAATEADVPAAPAPAAGTLPGAPATTTIAEPAASTDAGDERSAIAMIGGVLNGGIAGPTSGAFDDASRYVVVYGENLEGGLVIDRSNNTLLSGGPGDHPELGKGDDDTLVLQGDFSLGFGLPSQLHGLDTVVVVGDNNFSLTSSDDQIAPGETLTVNAMPLGAGHNLRFDGSAESNGRFIFFGSEAGDVFIGGAGNDRIAGLGGADMLVGGGGRDTFAYFGASESTGAAYDTLGDFDAGSDKIDLLGTVTGFHAPVESGTLSLATFDADLAAVLGGLGASQAAWFAPDAGDLAGQIFLIVDANGVAGYQEGEDYVFAVNGAPLVDLSGYTDIFA